MKELSNIEILMISGGEPNFLNVVMTSVVGGVVGFFVAGPVGVVVTFPSNEFQKLDEVNRN